MDSQLEVSFKPTKNGKLHFKNKQIDSVKNTLGRTEHSRYVCQ